MYVCVSCSHSVQSLCTRYGDNESSSAIGLTRCGACRSIADPYVEFEPNLLVLDLLLQRPPIYSHLLFNHRPTYIRRLVARLALFVWCMDVYLKLVNQGQTLISRANELLASEGGNQIMNHPILRQQMDSDVVLHVFYLFGATLLENLVFLAVNAILVVIWCRSAALDRESRWKSLGSSCGTMLLGLLLGSFGKMLMALRFIWSYHEPLYMGLLYLFVWTSQNVALQAWMNVQAASGTLKTRVNLNLLSATWIILAILAKLGFQYIIFTLVDCNYPITF